jgi:hypothetical protein
VCECVGGQRGTLQGIFLRRADPRAGTDDASLLILSTAFCHGGVRLALSTRPVPAVREVLTQTYVPMCPAGNHVDGREMVRPCVLHFISDTILGIRDRISSTRFRAKKRSGVKGVLPFNMKGMAMHCSSNVQEHDGGTTV